MKLTKEDKIKELEKSISLIKDALEKVKIGDKKYFIVIASQLRALICLGGKNFKPLLINLADELNFPLSCYGPSDLKDEPISTKKLILRISSRFISTEPSFTRRNYLIRRDKGVRSLLSGAFYQSSQRRPVALRH